MRADRETPVTLLKKPGSHSAQLGWLIALVNLRARAAKSSAEVRT
jgi:hypothetical protein